MNIYTDGGCSGNPGAGGWAYIIVKEPSGSADFSNPDDLSASILKEEWGTEKNTTNNRMELQAVISALETLSGLDAVPGETVSNQHPNSTIDVFTDSQYVQKGITEWILNWKRNSWRTKDKKPVKNQDLWQELDALTASFPITWAWIRGHAGNKYNERCDALTQKAIASL